MASSHMGGRALTLSFMTTKELPQMTVAATISGAASRARVLFSLCSMSIASLKNRFLF